MMSSEIVGDVEVEEGTQIQILVKPYGSRADEAPQQNIILYPRDKKYRLLIIVVKEVE